MFGWVVFWRDNQPFPLSCSSVNHFKYIYHILLAGQRPVHLIVISCSKVNHNMSISEEKHSGARIIELIHCVEVWNLCYINKVNNCEVADFLCTFIQNFILLHAGWIPVMAKPNADYSIFLWKDCLVYFPTII